MYGGLDQGGDGGGVLLVLLAVLLGPETTALLKMLLAERGGPKLIIRRFVFWSKMSEAVPALSRASKLGEKSAAPFGSSISAWRAQRSGSCDAFSYSRRQT